jgi:murein L,D-transpeptidase YcbB/YkuD
LFNDRVVVGTAEKQTPIFSKDMKRIVLRPEWNLPDSIKLTALLSGRSIERQGYVVMRNGHTVDSTKVNWARANLREYTFYQPAGDDNALGLVKFLFPNKHSVYLHDTPARYLFNESVRLFSHGCVRVRNPQQLAQDIFDIDRGPEAPDVKSLVRNGPKDNEIALNTPLPVHVGYFTVWVGDDGKPQYLRDYYGHQQRITLALAGQWNRIDIGKDHLAAVDTSALKRVFLSSDVRPRKSASRRRLDPPMGVTHDYEPPRYSGSSVGELILRSLGMQ